MCACVRACVCARVRVCACVRLCVCPSDNVPLLLPQFPYLAIICLTLCRFLLGFGSAISSSSL